MSNGRVLIVSYQSSSFDLFVSQVLQVMDALIESAYLAISLELNEPLEETKERQQPPSLGEVDLRTALASIRRLQMLGFVEARDFWSRDVFEQKIIALFHGKNLSIEIYPGVIRLYQAYFVHNKQIHNGLCKHQTSNPTSAFDNHKRDIKMCKFREEKKGLFFFRNKKSDIGNFLYVNKILTCPFVVINKELITWLQHNNSLFPWQKSLSVNFSDIKFEFVLPVEMNEILEDKNSSVKICRELLDQKRLDYFRTHRKRQKLLFTTIDYVLVYLQLACYITSIICHIMTLTTYFLFPSLRCIAGLNTMFFCGTYMVALTLFGIAQFV